LQLVRLVLGEGEYPDAALALSRRTGGDPAPVLVHLLASLFDASVLAPLPSDDSRSPARARATIRREGDYWTVTFRARTVLVRDTRGLHYLVPLLRDPGRPIHVADLVGGRRTGDAERVRLRVTKGIGVVIERLRGCHAELAEHLVATVRRGQFCRYVPDPARPVTWETA
jgi:hypothetical protein